MMEKTAHKTEIACSTVDVNKETGKKMKLGIVIAMVMMATTLVLLAVIGGIYVYSYEKQCKMERVVPWYKEKYRFNTDKEDQVVDVDQQHHIERQITKGQDGQLTSIAVFNYRTRVVSLYFAQDEICYLIGGIREEIGTFEHSLKVLKGEDMTKMPAINMTYEVRDQLPVHDSSMITDDMVKYCSKANLFWLERVDNIDGDADSNRQKRRVCFNARWCFRSGVCIRVRRCFRGRRK